jgi:predicted transcriptional regulator
MARAALDWTQHDLAAAAGVSWRTVARFEGGESVLPARVQKIRVAFETQGVLFIDHGRWIGGLVPPRDKISRVD